MPRFLASTKPMGRWRVTDPSLSGRHARAGAGSGIVAIGLLLALVGAATALAIAIAGIAERHANALPDLSRGRPAGDAGAERPLPVMAFYMNWDAASRASLVAHLDAIAQVVPGVATVTGPDHRFIHEGDPDLAALLAAAPHAPALIPMVQNVAGDGGWDSAGTASLLASRAARIRLANQVTAMVAADHGAGVMLDMESLPAAAHPGYRALLADLHARFARRGWQLMIAAPVGDPDWDLRTYAALVDRIVLMAYDEHWMGGEPGAIASQRWFAEVVPAAVKAVGAGKAIVAIGSYAYDWSAGHTDPLTVEAARTLARQAGTAPTRDAASGNSHFAYRKDGRDHQVWLLDATTAAQEMPVIRQSGAAGVALWRLGSEDAQVWPVLTGARRP